MEKTKIYLIIILLSLMKFAIGQDTSKSIKDTLKINEVIVTANRIPLKLKASPSAISIVSHTTLEVMPKTIGVEEALRLVPGVRIDNQHDGEKVHVSIRGQGILTENGLRGIGVWLDGIPLNDPSGFVPDLYDVDWATVKNIEVLRGPSAGLYGSGGAAGILNINTQVGGDKPVGGAIMQSIGSNGFAKTMLQANGSKNILDYRITYSRTQGNGYRMHQAFRANNLYEKINIKLTDKIKIGQIISHTDYFQQNPEGLNISQLNDPKQANPDAIPYNEYQKTNRTTAGITGDYSNNKHFNLHTYMFYRTWRYKETSNKYASYNDYTNPGAGLLYSYKFNTWKIKNSISIGTDYKTQTITTHKFQSAPNPLRKDNVDETNIETDSLLANEDVSQQSIGVFMLYEMNFGKLNVIGNIRHDNITNQLTNKMIWIDTAVTKMNFIRTSIRLGINYEVTENHSVFANFSQGFIPPSTEELAANPVGYSGFNTHLVPATANSYEMGIRGYISKNIYYDITAFLMNTQNDFFRFKQRGRGNQEVFYGNAGNSKRSGIETYLSAQITKKIDLRLAYTYSDFRYTSAQIDPVYLDTNYVLTTPPQAGQYLPNSPKHQLFAELGYKVTPKLKITLSTQYQSKWAIYTDSKAYNGELDPAIYQNWQKGYNLYNAQIIYKWNIKSLSGEISIAARNITGVNYIAFTEPDPDGNSYHPGPRREFFATMKINL